MTESRISSGPAAPPPSVRHSSRRRPRTHECRPPVSVGISYSRHGWVRAARPVSDVFSVNRRTVQQVARLRRGWRVATAGVPGPDAVVGTAERNEWLAVSLRTNVGSSSLRRIADRKSQRHSSSWDSTMVARMRFCIPRRSRPLIAVDDSPSSSATSLSDISRGS